MPKCTSYCPDKVTRGILVWFFHFTTSTLPLTFNLYPLTLDNSGSGVGFIVFFIKGLGVGFLEFFLSKMSCFCKFDLLSILCRHLSSFLQSFHSTFVTSDWSPLTCFTCITDSLNVSCVPVMPYRSWYSFVTLSDNLH